MVGHRKELVDEQGNPQDEPIRSDPRRAMVCLLWRIGDINAPGSEAKQMAYPSEVGRAFNHSHIAAPLR